MDEEIMREEQNSGFENALARATRVVVVYPNLWGLTFWASRYSGSYAGFTCVVQFEGRTMNRYSGLTMLTVTRLLERISTFNSTTISPLRLLDDLI